MLTGYKIQGQHSLFLVLRPHGFVVFCDHVALEKLGWPEVCFLLVHEFLSLPKHPHNFSLFLKFHKHHSTPSNFYLFWKVLPFISLNLYPFFKAFLNKTFAFSLDPISPFFISVVFSINFFYIVGLFCFVSYDFSMCLSF